jgi:hypothetical protein
MPGSVADPDPHLTERKDDKPKCMEYRMSLFDYLLFKGLSLIWKLGSGPDPNQSDKQDPDPNKSDADPQQ